MDEVKEYDTNGNLISQKDTLATEKLKTLKFNPNEDEKKMINLWENIIEKAKTTENYNPKYTYGPFQIEQELNTLI